MNPFRNRTFRTVVLAVAGYGVAWLLALVLVPLWPGLCEDATVGMSCDAVAVQTMTGYLVIALGILTMIFGPIAGSLIDLVLNGADWETPRGTENVITNMPLLIGGIYLVSGLVIAATA